MITKNKIVSELNQINDMQTKVMNDLATLSETVENLRNFMLQNHHHADTCLTYIEAEEQARAMHDNKLEDAEGEK